MKATNTTFYLTAEENGIINEILEAYPFLKRSKSAAVRYALFYWAHEPKCPECEEPLKSGAVTGIWVCPSCFTPKTDP